jgi:hypothetical protein
MAYSVFLEKSKTPGERELAKALGKGVSLWRELKRLIVREHDASTEEWVFSGKNYGWSLRLKQKKRAILYMTPCEEYFRVSFALGEKAVHAAHQSDLPPSALHIIDSAPKYPEGRGVRMEVRNSEDVRIAVKIAGIKMAN